MDEFQKEGIYHNRITFSSYKWEHMKNNSKPDVSIVCLTWNRKRFLEIGLPSLFSSLSNEISHEIILMDNASSDGTLDELRRYADNPEVKIVENKKNLRYKGFNRLFGMAQGRVIIEVDDDVIEFPRDFDKIAIEYLVAYPDYGYLAFDTVRNEFTDGNRGTFKYVDERGARAVEEGEARGYLAAFRRRDYRVVRPFTFFFPFSIEHPQDWVVSGLIRRILFKRMGVIRGVRCLHACGPLYAQKFGRTKLDLANLELEGASDRIAAYRKRLEESRAANN